jgi:hypothetical protein
MPYWTLRRLRAAASARPWPNGRQERVFSRHALGADRARFFWNRQMLWRRGAKLYSLHALKTRKYVQYRHKLVARFNQFERI